jgi:hypothetical protein
MSSGIEEIGAEVNMEMRAEVLKILEVVQTSLKNRQHASKVDSDSSGSPLFFNKVKRKSFSAV